MGSQAEIAVFTSLFILHCRCTERAFFYIYLRGAWSWLTSFCNHFRQQPIGRVPFENDNYFNELMYDDSCVCSYFIMHLYDLRICNMYKLMRSNIWNVQITTLPTEPHTSLQSNRKIPYLNFAVYTSGDRTIICFTDYLTKYRIQKGCNPLIGQCSNLNRFSMHDFRSTNTSTLDQIDVNKSSNMRVFLSLHC